MADWTEQSRALVRVGTLAGAIALPFVRLNMRVDVSWQFEL